jgi:hypothetical protein
MLACIPGNFIYHKYLTIPKIGYISPQFLRSYRDSDFGELETRVSVCEIRAPTLAVLNLCTKTI